MHHQPQRRSIIHCIERLQLTYWTRLWVRYGPISIFCSQA